MNILQKNKDIHGIQIPANKLCRWFLFHARKELKTRNNIQLLWSSISSPSIWGRHFFHARFTLKFTWIPALSSALPAAGNFLTVSVATNRLELSKLQVAIPYLHEKLLILLILSGCWSSAKWKTLPSPFSCRTKKLVISKLEPTLKHDIQGVLVGWQGLFRLFQRWWRKDQNFTIVPLNMLSIQAYCQSFPPDQHFQYEKEIFHT